MSLFERLFGGRAPPPEPPGLDQLREQVHQLAEKQLGVYADLAIKVQQLTDRLEALDIRQVEREAQFTETRDAVLRHLKRVQELQRRKEEESGTEDPQRSALTDQVLRMKLNRGS